MKRILVIPHVPPNATLRIRSVEIAQRLARRADFRVYVLDWPQMPHTSSSVAKLVMHAFHSTQTSRRPRSSLEKNGVTFVTIPHLVSPYPFNTYFNARSLERFIREENIDCVINANSHHFCIPRSILSKVLYVYDLVDDHLSPEPNRAWKKTRNITLGELRKAHRIITISKALQDLLAKEGFPKSTLIPNGVAYQLYQENLSSQVKRICKQYNLGGQFVIAYIGNHRGWFANTSFLVEAFRDFHVRHPKTRLLVVGPVRDGEEEEFASDSIIFTGKVPVEEIVGYYQTCDLGVLPFKLSPFTENALPLKIIEYGAAGKRVVASPLRELKTLAFPHVNLVPLDKDKWLDAWENEFREQGTWKPDWDAVIQEYDWDVVVADLAELILDGSSQQGNTVRHEETAC